MQYQLMFSLFTTTPLLVIILLSIFFENTIIEQRKSTLSERVAGNNFITNIHSIIRGWIS